MVVSDFGAMADQERETKHCSGCGMSGTCAPGASPDGWSFGFENGRTTFTCATCIRSNIRAIEGKLSTDWWE